MPGPSVVDVRGDDTLPKKVDVVVIGGGIVGASTALELARRGLSVAICEKGGIGHEQSSRNWGWVRMTMRDAREIPLMAHSQLIWETLDELTGHDTGYRKCGLFYPEESSAAKGRIETWAKLAKEFDLGAEMLEEHALRARLPHASKTWKGSVFAGRDGYAEPQKATSAIAEGARRFGAKILTRCAVRGFERSAGKISAVITERGPIGCSAVVLAGGAWSSLFSGPYGVDIPQLNVLNTVLRTGPVVGGPTSAIWTDVFALRPRQDGGYTIGSGTESVIDIVPRSFRYARAFLPAFISEWRSLSFRLGREFVDELKVPRRWQMDEVTPFEKVRVLDPRPSPKGVRQALRQAQRIFAALANANVEQVWGGYLDVTPDAIPIISGVAEIPGFFIATGFSGHGFGIAPGAGRLMADIVTGHAPIVSPEPFRFSRF